MVIINYYNDILFFPQHLFDFLFYLVGSEVACDDLAFGVADDVAWYCGDAEGLEDGRLPHVAVAYVAPLDRVGGDAAATVFDARVEADADGLDVVAVFFLFPYYEALDVLAFVVPACPDVDDVELTSEGAVAGFLSVDVDGGEPWQRFAYLYVLLSVEVLQETVGGGIARIGLFFFFCQEGSLLVVGLWAVDEVLTEQVAADDGCGVGVDELLGLAFHLGRREVGSHESPFGHLLVDVGATDFDFL